MTFNSTDARLRPTPTLSASAPGLNGRLQFSLDSLFEFTAICCLIAALSSLIGLTAGLFLMAFALSLLTRSGTIAIIMLISASLTAGLVGPDNGAAGFISQLAIVTTTACICLRYRFRAAQMRTSP